MFPGINVSELVPIAISSTVTVRTQIEVRLKDPPPPPPPQSVISTFRVSFNVDLTPVSCIVVLFAHNTPVPACQLIMSPTTS